MKRILPFAAILAVTLCVTISAQDVGTEDIPEISLSIDADNPGMGLLDQATEAKLRASTPQDLARVIDLCQRAKRAGLSGDNLRFANQLLAASQLQRGLFLAQQLLAADANNARPSDWREYRRRILIDLEEAITIIRDQPVAYLRIAELNLLPGGNETRATEALKLAIQSANNEPAIQFRALQLLANLEPDADHQAAILATAARSGNPQMMLLQARTLFDLNRNNEAVDVLQRLIEAESGNVALHERILSMFIDIQEHESVMAILDMLRARGTDDVWLHRIDLMRAEIFAKQEQFDDALKLINSLVGRAEGNEELMVLTLLLRSATYLVMDNLAEALKAAEAAESLRPELPPVLEHKFTILIAQENYVAALATARRLRAIEDRPQYALREILMLNELGRHSDAIEVAQKLREEYPEDEAQWIIVLFEIHIKHKAYDDALALVKEQQRPGLLPVLEHKFSMLVEQENFNLALAVARQLRSIEDRPPYALREILILNELGRHADAVEIAQKLREDYPEDESQWAMILVEIHTRHEAYDQALALVEEQLKEHPHELRWIFAKARIFTEQEKWDETIAWLESHLARDPDALEINLFLFSLFADQGRYRAARERLRPLLTRNPDDLDLLRFDAQMSISLGQHFDAVRVLTRVIEADPEDYTSINNLAWILCTSPIDLVRNGRRAVELAERAAELTQFQRAFVLSTLASAYAEVGDFERAKEMVLKGIEVAKTEEGRTEEQRREMLEHFQKEWDAFSQGMPFREILTEGE